MKTFFIVSKQITLKLRDMLFTQVENMQLGTSWLLMILGIKGRTKFKLPVSCFLKDIDEAYAYIPLTDYAWTKNKDFFF